MHIHQVMSCWTCDDVTAHWPDPETGALSELRGTGWWGEKFGWKLAPGDMRTKEEAVGCSIPQHVALRMPPRPDSKDLPGEESRTEPGVGLRGPRSSE